MFLGLIAGREYAFAAAERTLTAIQATKISLSDLGKAYIGLVVSVDLARGLPWLAEGLAGETFKMPSLEALCPTVASACFLIFANILLIPVGLFLAKQNRPTMAFMGISLAAGTIAFFVFPIA